MPIVTIGGPKGGTGKSTLATNLAVEHAIRSGKPVALINSDPQNTAGKWSDERKDEQERRASEGGAPLQPIKCFSLFGRHIHTEIKALAEQYDLVVVDGAARDAVEFRSACLVSNLVVVPLRPSAAELWTVPKVEEILTGALENNPDLIAVWIMNQVRQTSRDARRAEMTEALADSMLRPMHTIVTILDQYADCLGLGLGVCEIPKPYRNNRAETEMAFFHKEVMKWL